MLTAQALCSTMGHDRRDVCSEAAITGTRQAAHSGKQIGLSQTVRWQACPTGHSKFEAQNWTSSQSVKTLS
jgi:hypothetical protein